jgi:hypothetical protein
VVRVVVHDGCPAACVDGAAFACVVSMWHVKIVPGRSPDRPAIEALITAACDDLRARLEADAATPR